MIGARLQIPEEKLECSVGRKRRGQVQRREDATVSGKLFSDIAGGMAECIAQNAQRGAPYQMSVGLYSYDEEYVSSSQRVKVNGAEHAERLTVLRSGTIRECSILALGADDKTTAPLLGRDVTQPARTLSASAIYAARRRAAWSI